MTKTEDKKTKKIKDLKRLSKEIEKNIKNFDFYDYKDKSFIRKITNKKTLKKKNKIGKGKKKKK